MKFSPKPLHDQVVVITGATSGIGLVTARQAARRGARLVLNARNESTLSELVQEIHSTGGSSVAVPGDVGSFSDVQQIAQAAVDQFGGFDTWINNAGVSIYGRLAEVDLDDHRRLFETNYWGVVHGSLAAVSHLREKGGVLINIGSVLSDRAIPLQGAYCASKHAVKGFTDALRMELEKEGAPIHVTLVKPSAVDTPYRQHAKVYLAVEPLNPPPVYAPEVVAEAVLHCAEHPRRDVYVGGGGRALSLIGQWTPRGTDWLHRALFFRLQKSDEPIHSQRSNALYQPSSSRRERGGYPGHVAESSVYTTASLNPLATAALTAALAVGVTAWIRRRP